MDRTFIAPMKRLIFVLIFLLVGGTACAFAQVVPSAIHRQFSLSAGGTVSVFQPDYEGNWNAETNPVTPCLSTSISCVPAAEASSNGLIGIGAFVDVKLTRWVQLEAEGRWQRFNKYQGITQDNYLVGPRIPVFRFWKSTLYGKALGGFSEMRFSSYPSEHGHFTTAAFGGGMDVKLTKRISLRAFDAEYQYWPSWGNTTLSPYGVSAGIGYKIF
jgi:hypothetical protein